MTTRRSRVEIDVEARTRDADARLQRTGREVQGVGRASRGLALPFLTGGLLGGLFGISLLSIASGSASASSALFGIQGALAGVFQSIFERADPAFQLLLGLFDVFERLPEPVQTGVFAILGLGLAYRLLGGFVLGATLRLIAFFGFVRAGGLSVLVTRLLIAGATFLGFSIRVGIATFALAVGFFTAMSRVALGILATLVPALLAGTLGFLKFTAAIVAATLAFVTNPIGLAITGITLVLGLLVIAVLDVVLGLDIFGRFWRLLWRNLPEPVRDAVNNVIGFFNRLIGAYNSLRIPKFDIAIRNVTGPGGFSIPIPSITARLEPIFGSIPRIPTIPSYIPPASPYTGDAIDDQLVGGRVEGGRSAPVVELNNYGTIAGDEGILDLMSRYLEDPTIRQRLLGGTIG